MAGGGGGKKGEGGGEIKNFLFDDFVGLSRGIQEARGREGGWILLRKRAATLREG